MPIVVGLKSLGQGAGWGGRRGAVCGGCAGLERARNGAAGASGGARLHVGFACPELVGKPLEGVRDADAQGAEALAVALEGHLDGWCTAQEIVEEVTPAGGVGLRICPSWRHDML